jgi:hypothetical protein
MHNEMVLVYVDDILVFAKDPKTTMNELGKLYKRKPKSVHELDIYLRANTWKRSNCRTVKWNGLWPARRMSRMPSELLKQK